MMIPMARYDACGRALDSADVFLSCLTSPPSYTQNRLVANRNSGDQSDHQQHDPSHAQRRNRCCKTQMTADTYKRCRASVEFIGLPCVMM